MLIAQLEAEGVARPLAVNGPCPGLAAAATEAGSDVFTLYSPLISLRAGAPCLAGPLLSCL